MPTWQHPCWWSLHPVLDKDPDQNDTQKRGRGPWEDWPTCGRGRIYLSGDLRKGCLWGRGGYPAGGQAGNGLEGLSCKPLGNLSLQMPELQKSRGGISLEVQWKNLPCKAVDTGSIPGGDAKIPHAAGQLSPQDPNHCVLVLCSLSDTAREPEWHKERSHMPQLRRCSQINQ